jgi:hypothetical protein
MKKLKMVKVFWGDAWGRAGWSRDVKLEPCLVESIGYLVDSNKEGVMLAQGIAEDGAYVGIGMIPKGMIKKVKVLR